ncbi:MAG: RimK-like ATP-grasp domain, partial [Bacteroidota bacterium]
MKYKDYLLKNFNDHTVLNYPQTPEEFKKIVMFSTMSQEQEQNPTIVEKIKKVFLYQDDADDYACSLMEKEMPLLLWGKKTLIEESQILAMTKFDPFPKGIYNNPKSIITSKKDLTQIYQKENYKFLPKTYFNKKDALENLDFPIIGKSLNSFQSRGVIKINNKKELSELSNEYDIFQQQIKISNEYRFIFFNGF